MKQWISAFIMMVAIAAQGALPPPREFLPTDNDLRSQVDHFVILFNQDIQRARTNADKFRAVSRVIDEIKTLRDNSIAQTAQDEAYMDLMISVLESVPAQKNFKKRDCLRYENDMLNQFEPTAEDAPAEPAVKPGWAALRSLCR